ncbi:MAG: phosphotransferase enzyme family protein [Acidiferrobacterales bacterium]
MPRHPPVLKRGRAALETARSIGLSFAISGRPVQAVALEGGHIHDTYVVTYAENGRRVRYVLQRINRHIFPEPAPMMGNIERVTRHLRTKLEPEYGTHTARHTLTLVSARDGRPYFVDETSAHWRVYLYIEGTRTYDVIDSQELAREAAGAFGRFVRLLTDLPGPRLHDTIADFHNAARRFQALRQALQLDANGRSARARAEIDFALARVSLTQVLPELQARGVLREYVVHNDTKINNVLFDVASGKAVCVIDLDTVMPGLVLYDFGDLVRSATSPSSEDERDLDRVCLRLGVFEALVEGYVEAAAPLLTAEELSLLPFAGKLVALEIGVRFLTDYLEGDVYFKTRYPDHNLDRARNQFRLVLSIEQQEPAMGAVVARVCND